MKNIKDEFSDLDKALYSERKPYIEDEIDLGIASKKAIDIVENTYNFLRERKSIYQKRVNRAYEQEQKAKCLLQDEPDREDVKDDLTQCIKLQDRYNALIEFIKELESEITI